ncbi:MAG: exosortase C-terminal domain/associated protein EpsI [Terriglobia bacterium]
MMPTTSSWIRMFPVVVLLAGAGLFLHSRSQPELLPPHNPLASFPSRVGDWQGRDLALSPSIREVLGEGEFLVRIYERRPDEPYIDLFLAFFPSQRMGSTMHSPQNCLPGSGWMPAESSRMELTRPGGGNIKVNRYVVTRGLDHMLVLYWYQAHGRVVASEYWGKFYLVADAIRMNRSDGALIRVTTPIAQNETLASAEKRGVTFVQEALPLLDSYIPR